MMTRLTQLGLEQVSSLMPGSKFIARLPNFFGLKCLPLVWRAGWSQCRMLAASDLRGRSLVPHVVIVSVVSSSFSSRSA